MTVGAWVVLMGGMLMEGRVENELLSAQRRVPDAAHTMPIPLKGAVFYGTAGDAKTVARTPVIAIASIAVFLLGVAAIKSEGRGRAN